MTASPAHREIQAVIAECLMPVYNTFFLLSDYARFVSKHSARPPSRPSSPPPVSRKPSSAAPRKPQLAPPSALPPSVKSLPTPLGTPVLPDCVWPVQPASGIQGLLANKFFLKVLGISLLLHMGIMTVHFSHELSNQWNQHQVMEVVLVNSATKEAPTKAEVLAQANLDGGGNTDEDRQAKTPLPKLPKDSQKTELEATVEKREELEKTAQQLMVQQQAVKKEDVETPQEQTPPAPERPDANKLMNQTVELMQLEAQIQKEMDAYQKRPRKYFVGSRAQEYRFARYIEDWRIKVERIGNLNYPEAARREQLYGSLRMTVAINSDGSVNDVTIDQSSGHRILDAAAQKIVEMASPYGVFPPDIRDSVDILYITRTWSFTRGSGLETHAAER
ncbi:MAG: TonB family protein [Betaproteobacteria bacterium]|nr:TonB family protein [Betaproteobacteria bacterium]